MDGSARGHLMGDDPDHGRVDPAIDASRSVDAASEQVRRELDRLLFEADQIADRLATRPPEIDARERELDELEALRLALLERTDAANERFEAAERLVEESQARLAEIADAQRTTHETLETANLRAAAIVAEAETKAANLQAQAERKAVARIRRSERDAADRLVEAEDEAQRIVADAVAVLREAEGKAHQTVASVQRRVDALVDEATRARHAEVDQLRAREQAVEDRIRELLAEPASLSSLPRAALRTEPAFGGTVGDDAGGASASTIDLTDVSEAINDAIDDWMQRRNPH